MPDILGNSPLLEAGPLRFLALALLVLGVGADDADLAETPDDLAFHAHLLD
jgi:hypothetical protein